MKQILILLCLIALACFTIITGSDAFAQTNPAPGWGTGPNNTPTNFCNNGGLLAARVVDCVQKSLDLAILGSNGSNGYLHAFSAFMQPAIYTGIVLALILLGIRVLMGDHEIKPKLFGMMFKIGIILWLTNDFGGLLPSLYGFMSDLQNIVSTTLMQSSTHCPFDPNNTMAVWNRMDCLVSKLVGSGVPNATMDAGIIGLLGAAMFSGTTGLQLLITGLSAMLMVMLVVFRSVYTFLLAYTAIAFLVLMSPLIVPLIAFDRTINMVYQWMKQFISAMVEPMVLFAFLAFFFGTMEDIVFGRFAQEMQQVTGNYKTGGFGATSLLFDQDTYKDLFPGQEGKKFTDALNPIFSGASNVGGLFNFIKLDLGADHDKKMYELIVSMISMIVTAYVMMSMIALVPSLARNLVGLGEAVGTGTGLGTGISQIPGASKANQKLELASTNAGQVGGSRGGLGGIGDFFGGMRKLGGL